MIGWRVTRWSVSMCILAWAAPAAAKLQVTFSVPPPPDGYWVVRAGMIDEAPYSPTALLRKLRTSGFFHSIGTRANLDANSSYQIYPVCNGVPQREFKPVGGAESTVSVRCR